MTLLGAEYASSEDDERSATDRQSAVPPAILTTQNITKQIIPAPEISLDNHATRHSQLVISTPISQALTYNAPYAELSRPTQGPVNPFKSKSESSGRRRNVITGHAQETNISDATFTTQQRTFQARGYALEPNSTGRYVGDLAAAQQFQGRDIIQQRVQGQSRKRQKKGDPAIVDGEGAYVGPWAKPLNEAQYEEREVEGEDNEELASDEEYIEEAIVPSMAAPMDKAATAYADDSTNAETSEFHGADRVDYLGRSIMLHPPEKIVDIERCYHPKRLVHEWHHGSKPITALRFFPRSSHLLLSGSADTHIKIFDVFRDQQLLRTYSGHRKALSDVEFSPSGSQMLSAGLDRYMKLWDVETGACITRLKTGAIPYVVRFNPAAPHEFLAGMSDKKIVQFDTRVPPEDSDKSIVQEYDHHLGPVNTLTFVDDNRRFISTSDDKSLRAWEINIPVPIKFIAEPYMYAMTRACLHPNGKHALFQSGDNQIVVYAAGDRFRQNRKKSFRGHNTSGYAVDIDMSPDGGMVASGDSGGYVCFWDWKTCKMYHKIKAAGENAAITCVKWNQQTTSRVATAGTEGVIKYWD